MKTMLRILKWAGVGLAGLVAIEPIENARWWESLGTTP